MECGIRFGLGLGARRAAHPMPARSDRGWSGRRQHLGAMRGSASCMRYLRFVATCGRRGRCGEPRWREASRPKRRNRLLGRAPRRCGGRYTRGEVAGGPCERPDRAAGHLGQLGLAAAGPGNAARCGRARLQKQRWPVIANKRRTGRSPLFAGTNKTCRTFCTACKLPTLHVCCRREAFLGTPFSLHMQI